MIHAILFDLDGTLVDTAPEIADAVNNCMKRLGLPNVGLALVRSWIGQGTRSTFTSALTHAGIPAHSISQHWASFAYDYSERCGSSGQVYPGAQAALQRLRDLGLRLGVVTNKEGSFAHRVLVRHGLSEYFDVVVGGDSLSVRKHHPRMLTHALDAIDYAPSQALFIGDSVHDVHTARAACVPIWAVRHGYHNDLLHGIDQPDRWLDSFDQLGVSSWQFERSKNMRICS